MINFVHKWDVAACSDCLTKQTGVGRRPQRPSPFGGLTATQCAVTVVLATGGFGTGSSDGGDGGLNEVPTLGVEGAAFVPRCGTPFTNGAMTKLASGGPPGLSRMEGRCRDAERGGPSFEGHRSGRPLPGSTRTCCLGVRAPCTGSTVTSQITPMPLRGARWAAG